LGWIGNFLVLLKDLSRRTLTIDMKPMNTWLRYFLASVLAMLTLSASAQGLDDSYPLIDTSGFPPVIFRPSVADATPVMMVVLLAGDPVAVAQKKAGGLLTRAEKDAIVAQRKSDQAAVQPQIEARGAKVLATFQNALNGIKVRIAKNLVDTLRTIPGVLDIKPVGVYEPSLTVSVPFTGAPGVWSGPPSNRGQSIKIAIVDTGIDYTHANFGGPGTVAAFEAARATSTAPADPALFGDLAPKVKGGIDLVGDDYNGFNEPVPDPNPLDCGGHGSHVAGIAAGFGVNADGTTFSASYDASIYTPHAFLIGPGVAPLAKLYAVRVFGCSGSTRMVSEAIEWAVANDMDVINMSLGADFGTAGTSESVAIHNATGAGILVIAASGNAGPFPYITSSPASSDGAVSVAATDAHASYPAATLTLSGVAQPILVQNSNGALFDDGKVYPIVVLRNPDGTVSLGCNEAEYDPTRNGGISIAGKLVVVLRGTCARVFRAGAGQKYGAAAVAMINNGPGYPPFEGDISGNDPSANPFDPVTIPFFGVLQSDATTLTGPTGGPAPATATAMAAAAGSIPNPTFAIAAIFSSSGPRTGDSVLKPSVTAPGVSVQSTAMGTGNRGVRFTGTSMATPHVAGVAALVKKANPKWSAEDQRAAVVQTASASTMRDYSPRIEGSGEVEAMAAVNTQAVVRTDDDSLSFGFADLLQDFHGSRSVSVHNYGKSAITFNLSVAQVLTGAGVQVNIPPTVTVGGRGDATLTVALDVPASSIGGTHNASGATVFREIGGYVKFSPASPSMNGGAALTIPYYLVPRSRSRLSAVADPFGPAHTTAQITVSNHGGVLAGTPAFYALGLTTPLPQGVTYADTRAVGVRAVAGANPTLVFAINTFDRFSNPSGNSEWDVIIDTDAGGHYVLVGINGSSVSANPAVQNKLVAAPIDLSTFQVTALRFADAATDNSTVLLPVKASELGLTAAQPRFTYQEQHFSSTGAGATPGTATFNAFTPSLKVSYAGGAIAAGGSAAATVTVNAAEWVNSPPLGVMVVAQDNVSGPSQAQLLPAGP
jgi:minor extracellular serine protease Vpr